MPDHGLAINRRTAIAAAMATGIAGAATAPADAEAAAGPSPDLKAMALRFPAIPLVTINALELLVETGESVEIGAGPLGYRRMVPITGGQFQGPGLSGKVLSGGADRQLIRRDGIRELDATYELLADDGTLLMVHNRVIVDDAPKEEGLPRYARSVVQVQAPDGQHAWLNRRLLLGTLDSLRPKLSYVFLRFFYCRLTG